MTSADSNVVRGCTQPIPNRDGQNFQSLRIRYQFGRDNQESFYRL